MTTMRRDGNDSPFGTWLRSRKNLDSHLHAFVASDIDWSFHKYSVESDRLGERDVQCSMNVELKCYGRKPKHAQMEVLFFQHQLLNTMGRAKMLRKLGGEPVAVWHFGFCVLCLEHDAPADGDKMQWGVFQKNGSMKWFTTHREDRIEMILGFQLRPDNPQQRLSLRRHHKTREVTVKEECELGFTIESKVVCRS